MYTWIWQHLPGNATCKAVQSVLIAVALAVFLWYVVFPWLITRLPTAW